MPKSLQETCLPFDLFSGGKETKEKNFLSVPRVNSPGTKDSENECPGRANSGPSI